MCDRVLNENSSYLTEQLVTYIGNKRSLITFIDKGVSYVQSELEKNKLNTFDVFSGSGIVSRYLKQFSKKQYANDMETYARIINECYLTNKAEIDLEKLCNLLEDVKEATQKKVNRYLTKDYTAFKDAEKTPGFISEFYAPKNLYDIQFGERCFYTPYNACYIDCARQAISKKVPEELQK